MIGFPNSQFKPSSYITKILEPKKVIFLLDINQVSTINEHFPEPIPPHKYEHLLSYMWGVAPCSPVIVLPPDVNIYWEGSINNDPFS